jgi:hypothetical protein
LQRAEHLAAYRRSLLPAQREAEGGDEEEEEEEEERQNTTDAALREVLRYPRTSREDFCALHVAALRWAALQMMQADAAAADVAAAAAAAGHSTGEGQAVGGVDRGRRWAGGGMLLEYTQLPRVVWERVVPPPSHK